MSFQNFLASVDFSNAYSAADKAILTDAFETLWNGGSGEGARWMTRFVREGGFVEIAPISLSPARISGPHATTDPSAIYIDTVLDEQYFDHNGIVHDFSLERTLIHELLHAHFDFDDPTDIPVNLKAANPDYVGKTVRITNEIMADSVLAEAPRASYFAAGRGYTDGDSPFLPAGVTVGTVLFSTQNAKAGEPGAKFYTHRNTENVDDLLVDADHRGTIYSGLGDDFIFAGGGNDRINGGAGNDYIDGEAGWDEVRYMQINRDASGPLQTGFAADFEGDGAGLTARVEDGWGGVDTLRSIEFIRGSDAFDDALAMRGDLSIYNAAGFRARAGDLADMTDNDTLLLDLSTAVTLRLASGKLSAGNASVRLRDFESAGGTAFDDNLQGSLENNTIGGFIGDDVVRGVGGDNVLIGGAGIDDLIGADGNDILFFDHEDRRVVGGGGHDIAVADVASDGLDMNLIHSSVETVIGTADADRFVMGGDQTKYVAGGGGTDHYVIKTGGSGLSVIWDASADHTLDIIESGEPVLVEIATFTVENLVAENFHLLDVTEAIAALKQQVEAQVTGNPPVDFDIVFINAHPSYARGGILEDDQYNEPSVGYGNVLVNVHEGGTLTLDPYNGISYADMF